MKNLLILVALICAADSFATGQVIEANCDSSVASVLKANGYTSDNYYYTVKAKSKGQEWVTVRCKSSQEAGNAKYMSVTIVAE